MDRLRRLASSFLAAASIASVAFVIAVWPGVVQADDEVSSPTQVGWFLCTCSPCGGACSTTVPVMWAPNTYTCGFVPCTGGCGWLGGCDATCGCSPTIPAGTLTVVCACF
jgi:hypothetical protein